MFIVEFEVIKDNVFNNDTMQFEPCEQYYYNPCGSDYTIIYRDLKTLTGVCNRLKNIKLRKDVKRVSIYQTHNIYDRKSYRLVSQYNVIKEV